jgi:hypothetical protein
MHVAIRQKSEEECMDLAKRIDLFSEYERKQSDFVKFVQKEKY